MHYLSEPCANYVHAAVAAAVDVHKADLPGDVLVFLTGQQVSSSTQPTMQNRHPERALLPRAKAGCLRWQGLCVQPAPAAR